MRALDRVLLLATSLLAGYQVVVLDGLESLALASYTVAFGVLLLAGLLLIIFGFEALESPVVVIVSALIPLSLSLGLVVENLPAWGVPYLGFAVAGLTAIALTRIYAPGERAAIALSLVHGVSGLTILGLPLFLALAGGRPPGMLFVGLGGALIGIGGLLLAFARAGRPLLAWDRVLALLPAVLLLSTGAFVAGFALV
jgi:hypothetical protein